MEFLEIHCLSWFTHWVFFSSASFVIFFQTVPSRCRPRLYRVSRDYPLNGILASTNSIESSYSHKTNYPFFGARCARRLRNVFPTTTTEQSKADYSRASIGVESACDFPRLTQLTASPTAGKLLLRQVKSQEDYTRQLRSARCTRSCSYVINGKRNTLFMREHGQRKGSS